MATLLKIQVGDKTISYEGDAADVANRFDALADRLLRESTQAAVSVTSSPEPTNKPQKPPPAPQQKAALTILSTWDELPSGSIEDRLARVFETKDGVPILRSQQWELGDSLLLIMYGFHYIIRERQVTAPALMKTARKSGIEIARADRPLAERKEFWYSEGERRGKKYGLNAVGVKHCEDLVRNELDLPPVADPGTLVRGESGEGP